ncbi:flavodoxin family protein [bacterium]|nr:flavodoxin family protein [bacterium]
MKKVLGLIGSPRKSGNSELMVKEISRHIPEEHELILIRLPEFNIEHCTGCYNCLFKEACHLKDDLYTVVDKIKEADGLIVSAPAYLFGANASLKNFIDRALAFYKHGDKMWGKPGIAIGVAGLEGKEGRTLLDLEGFLMGVGAIRKKSGMVFGALPGEALLNEKNRQIAKEFGEALFSAETERKEISCSLCGGQTFRFSEGNTVKCMLCSNDGVIKMNDGAPEFEMRIENDIALSNEAVLDHGAWLKGMKNKFKGSKEELKEIRKNYENDGTWVKPAKIAS